jgi:hypothetical protein
LTQAENCTGVRLQNFITKANRNILKTLKLYHYQIVKGTENGRSSTCIGGRKLFGLQKTTNSSTLQVISRKTFSINSLFTFFRDDLTTISCDDLSLHLLISTTISVTGIVLAATWPEAKRCEAYFIMLYARAGFWVVTWVRRYDSS